MKIATLAYRPYIRYPFDQLSVGEHFDILEAPRFNVSSAASHHAKAHPGRRFATSTLKSANGRETIRVWRVAK